MAQIIFVRQKFTIAAVIFLGKIFTTGHELLNILVSFADDFHCAADIFISRRYKIFPPPQSASSYQTSGND